MSNEQHKKYDTKAASSICKHSEVEYMGLMEVYTLFKGMMWHTPIHLLEEQFDLAKRAHKHLYNREEKRDEL